MRKHNCPACNAMRHGIRSRIAFEHVGCEFDRHTVALTNVAGSATFNGEPTKEEIEAVNALAEAAYKKLKKK